MTITIVSSKKEKKKVFFCVCVVVNAMSYKNMQTFFVRNLNYRKIKNYAYSHKTKTAKRKIVCQSFIDWEMHLVTSQPNDTQQINLFYGGDQTERKFHMEIKRQKNTVKQVEEKKVKN